MVVADTEEEPVVVVLLELLVSTFYIFLVALKTYHSCFAGSPGGGGFGGQG